VGFWIKHFAVGGFFESALCSWWIFRISTLQLVDFSNQHFAVGGFFKSALCCWWIFIREGSVLLFV